ncbi:MAG: phosphate/phosphite/phosphonate ABC transporter substrate-binding protein [Planctomycetota bacterium]
MNAEPATFSLPRALLVAVPIAALVGVGMTLWNQSVQKNATSDLQRAVMSTMLSSTLPNPETDFEFVDADDDLLADPPADAADMQQPSPLVFSYIAAELDEGEEADLSNWAELSEAIAQATGVPVSVKHYQSIDEQLLALREGEVHLVGLSTGAAPHAVATAGFHPLCTLAKPDGSVGYRMQVIAGSGSGVETLADLGGKKVVFVRPTSNSGFKAAFVLLHEAGLLPEQHYQWSFSLSHKQSIRDVVDGVADAAPVASDILQGMVDAGQIDAEDYRVVVESEVFPPAVLGCAHNLPADMVATLRETLDTFDWQGTGLERELGPLNAASFTPVVYKDDWANIRRIDDSVLSIIGAQ